MDPLKSTPDVRLPFYGETRSALSWRILHATFIYRTALVAKRRIHGRRDTIRDSYNAPITENVPAATVHADASHRDAMSVAATIANQLQMAGRDVIRQGNMSREAAVTHAATLSAIWKLISVSKLSIRTREC